MISDSIDLLEKTVRRDYSKDGIVELLLGLLLFFNAGMPYTVGIHILVSPIFTLLSMAITLCADKIVEYLRSKFTYPRIGYAEFKFDYSPNPPHSYQKYILLIISSISISYIFYLTDNSDLPIFWLYPVFIGLALFVLMLHQKRKADDSWALLYASISLISGLIFSFNQIIDPVVTMQYYLLSQSAFYLFVGLLRLVIFTQSHPVVKTVMEDV